MSVILGVSRNLSFLNYKPGDTNYWCVFKGHQKSYTGTLLLLYIPVGASFKYNGISQIYTIISEPDFSNTLCDIRGMATVNTRLLTNLKNHIRIKDMKRDLVLSTWGAVSRNMQGVTFNVNPEIWMSLRKMIIQNNPELETLLTV